jgi:hypothetical protein
VGAEPTVEAEEWTAGTVTFLPRTPSATSIKDYWPVAKLCSKLIIKDLICNARLKQAIEEYQLVDDVQEGFPESVGSSDSELQRQTATC